MGVGLYSPGPLYMGGQQERCARAPSEDHLRSQSILYSSNLSPLANRLGPSLCVRTSRREWGRRLDLRPRGPTPLSSRSSACVISSYILYRLFYHTSHSCDRVVCGYGTSPTAQRVT
eukprot:3758519-Pleurochrysis_carterae.AAC.4